MIRRDILQKTFILVIPAGLLIGGCATTKPQATTALEEARAAYAKVRDSNITTNAKAASQEAERALGRAEEAQDTATQEHLAYLARKKAEKAVALAEMSMAEKEVQSLGKEREKLLVTSRDLEVAKARREAEAARQQARAKDAELAELKAKQTERGMVITLGNVLFASGKASLLPGAMSTITNLAEFLQKNPDRKLLIEGHTDSVGTAQYNVVLSEDRADAVKKALMDTGVSADRIATKGYGKSYPIATNDTGAGRLLNRRVEVVVLDLGVTPEQMKRQ